MGSTGDVSGDVSEIDSNMIIGRAEQLEQAVYREPGSENDTISYKMLIKLVVDQCD